jgi:glycosyltransferase involved in cell wall biosynthesis
MNCGGAEAMLMNLYRRADRSRIQFDFLVSAPEPMFYEPEIASLGGRVFRIPSLRQSDPVRYQRRLLAFFRAHPEYRIVHSHLETTTGLILRQANHAGVPCRIAHSHNTRYPGSGWRALPERWLKDWCKRFILPNATCRLACSSQAAHWLFGAASAEVLRNGILTERFRFDAQARLQVRRRLGLSEETTLYLHVGRFQAQKNQAFLLEAWAELERVRPDAALVLIGEGEQRTAAQQCAARLKEPRRVYFLGQRDDVPRFLCAADCFVLPSLFEGLPLALAEALCAGLPCVVSDRVPTEALPGRITSLPLGDPGQWAAALLAQPLAGAKRAAAADALAAAGYDAAQSAARLTELYFQQISAFQ